MPGTGRAGTDLAAMAGHVVFLIGEDWFFASHFRVRAAAARAQGWRVSVLTHEGQAAAALRREGFEVHGVDFKRARLNPVAELRLLLDIARLYRRLKPDLVHHVALKPIVLGTLAAMLADVPAIINAPVGLGYVFSSDQFKARLLRPLVRQALHRLIGARKALAIFENEEDRAEAVRARALPLDRTIVIGGAGVDVRTFLPVPKPAHPVRIVLGARLLRQKGILDFIEAARLLRSRHVQAELVVAGAPDTENPNALTRAELEDPAINWVGRVDMVPLLESAHVACLPTFYREGLPKFLLEAMASGLPCVTTRVVGCREAVIDGETGLLVPPRDPVALADALERLIRNPDLRARMGAAGRARAETLFADEVVCAATLAVYERAIR